jgi:Protein kinase domain
VSAPNDAYQELLQRQRERNAPLFAAARAFAGFGYTALVLLGSLFLGNPEFAASTPVALGYFTLGSALWWGIKRSAWLRERVWYAVPLLDVPGVFLGQLIAGRVADLPTRVAVFTSSLYAGVILVSMLSFRTRTVLATAAAGLLAELSLVALLGGTGADLAAVAFSVSVCGMLAALVTRQIEDQLSFGAKKVVAEKVLNAEIRHQVAERSRSLGESFSQVEGPLAPSRLAAGATIASRYTVVKELGQGAMGAVYEVERATDQRRLALKLLTGVVTGNQAARFAREAEIGARVRHPNLVEILDVGVAASGTPFLAMELLEGGNLAERSARFGDVAWALPILRQVLAGLGALHAAGVVHRDLKPANVLVAGPDDALRVKISDFGISRLEAPFDSGPLHDTAAGLADTRPQALTHTGALLGTPLYMPPEAAWGGKEMGQPADVFAFGAMAYELLSGKRPFKSPVLTELLAQRPIPTLIPLVAEVGPALRALIERCLANVPEERPTLAELSAAL